MNSHAVGPQSLRKCLIDGCLWRSGARRCPSGDTQGTQIHRVPPLSGRGDADAAGLIVDGQRRGAKQLTPPLWPLGRRRSARRRATTTLSDPPGRGLLSRMLRSRCRSLHSCAAQYRRRGPSPGEGLVRVVRLMLAHGRVVVTMRHGRPHTRNHTRRSAVRGACRSRWCWCGRGDAVVVMA